MQRNVVGGFRDRFHGCVVWGMDADEVALREGANLGTGRGGNIGMLIQIASYTYPWQAHLAQGRLVVNGIRTFVFDDGIIYANPLLSYAVGGAKVMVGRFDAEKAVAILREPIDLSSSMEIAPEGATRGSE